MDLKQILEIFLYFNYKTIEDVIYVHKKIKELNELFYFNLAMWFIKNYKIQTHIDIFIANLFISNFIEHRKKASELLKNLDPYSINNIIDYIKGKVYLTKKERIFKPRLDSNIPRILKSSIKAYINNIDNIDFIKNNIKYIKQICCRCRINIINEEYKKVLFNGKKYNKSVHIEEKNILLNDLIYEYEKNNNNFLKKIIDFI